MGALRYFLLKFTRGTIIAFDFHDALSFEGETGPYCLYAIVRARGIWQKGTAWAGRARDAASLLALAADLPGGLLAAPGGDDLWDVVLQSGMLGTQIEIAISAQEPAFLAKYAFQLAQAFNLFYHKHHILSEEDARKKAFLLLVTTIVRDAVGDGAAIIGD